MRYTAQHSRDIFTPKPVGKIGLGTAIERALKPIARVVGRSGCSSCRHRARKLNRIMPNINPFA
jgi:hypothetical protein